jgi:hypothetical protein
VTTAPYRYQARVLLHGSLPVLADRVPPTSAVLTEAGAGQCLLTTGSDSLEAMTFHLLALEVEFTVLEPPELIDHLRRAGGRLQRAVASNPA